MLCMHFHNITIQVSSLQIHTPFKEAFSLEKNVGKTDKIIRYILAVIFVVLGFSVHWAFYILAFIAVVTAALILRLYKPHRREHLQNQII